MKIDTGPKIRRHGAGRERAILVGMVLPDTPKSYRAPLEELEQLADTAGADTVDKVVQRRERPDPRTFIGKGKAAALGERMRELEADLLIVDHDLSPSQARNLETAIGGGRVIDRTELILDIFVRRASSAMARKQVELAQMEYSLPRLKRLWTHLNREVGTAKAGIGGFGSGRCRSGRTGFRRRAGAGGRLSSCSRHSGPTPRMSQTVSTVSSFRRAGLCTARAKSRTVRSSVRSRFWATSDMSR